MRGPFVRRQLLPVFVYSYRLSLFYAVSNGGSQLTLSWADSKLIGFSLPENPISPLAWIMKSTIAMRRVGEIGDFCVDEAIGKANTLIEAMGWIRRFSR